VDAAHQKTAMEKVESLLVLNDSTSDLLVRLGTTIEAVDEVLLNNTCLVPRSENLNIEINGCTHTGNYQFV
jgi:hypothetical protein